VPKKFLPVLLVVVVALASCGGDDDDGSSQSRATTAASGASADAFPVTITADNGRVTIPERPERVISLSPTATEMLWAVGAGDQVVAVDDQSDYPKGVPTTELSGYEPNVEAIAGYTPDLVVMSDGKIAGELQALDIPLLVQPAAKNVDEAYRQIEQLGRATGHTEDARARVADIKAKLTSLVSDLPDDTAPIRFYHELDDGYYSASSATFIGSLYKMAGLENIADKADDGTGYPQLSAEYIVQSDPDIIFLADTECCGQSAQTIAARPGWNEIAAVRDGNVVALGDDVASRWGPRMVELLRHIVDAADKARANS
jgi:iron complex transport system substrate-binding protein